MNEQAAVGSLMPDDFTAGGFMDDCDVTVINAEVVEFDYAGKSDGGNICALAVTLRKDEREPDDEDRTEYLKIGDLSKFTPSADRSNYIPVGATTAMNKSCKCALFLKALKEKGFDMSLLAKGVKGLIGLHGHVNIVPMPKIKDSDSEPKVLIFTKIHGMVEVKDGQIAGGKKATGASKKSEKKADTPATTTASAPSGSTASSVDGADDAATGIILTLIAENEGKVNKSKIPPAMFSKIDAKDSKLRNACIGLAGNVGWLSGGDRPWKYDGGELSLG